MSAYLVVEFTVKDPDLYREQYAANAGKTAKEYGAEALPSSNWELLHGDGSLTSGHSCGFPTVRPPSSGTTRLNISG